MPFHSTAPCGLPQVAVFSRRFQNHFDRSTRALGESDAPFWRYSLEQYALGCEGSTWPVSVSKKPLFVGLSMGGYLEFALYRLYPEIMLGLVLADTRAEADKPEQIHWRFDPRPTDRGDGTRGGDCGDAAKASGPEHRYDRDPDLVARVKSMQAAAPVPGIIGDAHRDSGAAGFNVDLLPAITIPDAGDRRRKTMC